MSESKPFIGALALVWILSGCATPAKVANMTPSEISITNKHPHTVSTAVVGGEETSSLGMSKVSDTRFQKALTNAILESAVFSDVVSIGGSDYHLRVVITNLGQPMAGFDMTVTLTSHWELTKQGDSRPFWQSFVSTKYTATVGDAFVGVERIRVANEGAARANIKDGLQQLSELSLSSQ
jgi:hypothetical protein